jgi:hypothetical protein
VYDFAITQCNSMTDLLNEVGFQRQPGMLFEKNEKGIYPELPQKLKDKMMERYNLSPDFFDVTGYKPMLTPPANPNDWKESERAARFREVIAYFERKKSLSGINELSDFFGMSPSTISSARNGRRTYLSDEFFIRVWKASGKIYSLNWLLYGVGKKFNEDLIASDDIHKDQIIKNLKEEIDTKNTYIRTLEGYVEALKDKNDYLQRELTAKNTVSSGKEKSPKMGTLFANVVE